MKKNKLILLQVFIAFTLICTSVYAAISTTIGISIDKSTIERGETVSVKLSLKDVDENQKVTSVEGYVNYNKAFCQLKNPAVKRGFCCINKH